MIKFILRQSYKYILLILVILYMRYSVYYLNMILSLTKRPMMEILKYNLNENDESFYKNFFTFLLAYIGSSSFKEKQNIIQYFYIPINEIFLFFNYNSNHTPFYRKNFSLYFLCPRKK